LPKVKSVKSFASFIKTFYKWDPKHMVVSIHTRDLVRIHQEYEERDEPAPIVNVLGHHPAFHLGVVARNPWKTDDYTRIGPFLGEPLRLTPSATWGDRFLVPADAEVIIEGEIPPGQRDVCDPFGEVAGLYQAQCLRPVFEVKAITFRNRAIMQDIFSGYRDSYIGFHSIVKEAALEESLRPRFPNLHEVHLPDSGNGMSAAYISVRDAAPGQAQEIGRAALDILGLQLIVVVDADIDVFNETQVLWAMHTYGDPEEGFVQHRSAGRFIPQHTGPRSGFGTTNWSGRKLVVDATRPTNFAFGARSVVPRDVIARMPLSDYLSGEA
jgi:UbiD family decarboxylase